MMASLRSTFGSSQTQNTENSGFSIFSSSDNDDSCNIGKYFSLSYKQRFMGWGLFLVLGITSAIIGSIAVFSGRIVSFGVLYTISNVCLILASLFLFGPMRQLKGMFSTCHRACATSTYLVMIALTLYVAIKLHSGWACLFLVILQFMAYIWYTITSIPGGQTLCETAVGNIV